jgi:hypothetical protein
LIAVFEPIRQDVPAALSHDALPPALQQAFKLLIFVFPCLFLSSFFAVSKDVLSLPCSCALQSLRFRRVYCLQASSREKRLGRYRLGRKKEKKIFFFLLMISFFFFIKLKNTLSIYVIANCSLYFSLFVLFKMAICIITDFLIVGEVFM